MRERIDAGAPPPTAGARPPADAGEPPAALPAWRRPTRGEQRGEVSIAVGLMIVLQLALPGALTPVGRWTLPAIELAIALILVAGNPFRIERSSPGRRAAALALLVVAGLANTLAVGLLIRDLVAGTGGDDPIPLLATGANIWITNVIIFALLFWEFDRGGPAARAAATRPTPDFLFPQMADGSGLFRSWEPRFSDYAFVSFTNATAFSPTDTMPMSRWAKLAMMLESAVSLVTAALVIARAVNVLLTHARVGADCSPDAPFLPTGGIGRVAARDHSSRRTNGLSGALDSASGARHPLRRNDCSPHRSSRNDRQSADRVGPDDVHRRVHPGSGHQADPGRPDRQRPAYPLSRH